MADKIVEKVMDNFIQQGSNFKNLDENMQVLQNKIEELNCREADVRAELQHAELVSSKKRKREVENWLKNVDCKKRQIEEFQQMGTLNLAARRRLANQVVQEIDEVAKLFELGKFPEGIVLDVAVKESVPLVTFKVKGCAFEQNLENIWTWLMDDEVVSIGICGMGGVGKTTLAMHLHDKLLEEPKFSNCVYWVTVSQESSRFKLQNDIAKVMNIYISGEDDENKRAAILYRELSKREKFVLILDGIWEHFDVWKLGLPFKKHGCKFMLTSRFTSVCERIGCKKLITVETLSESEAWTLFLEELEQTNLAREVERTAQDVAKKCGGLPLAIISMARSMRGVTDVYEWKDALVELKECMARGSMGSEVLPILLCSFNRLGSPKLQQCFLYCSLYPENYDINRDELINMFIVEELMDSRSRRQEAMNQGHVILNKLENSCMLIRSNGGCVKMHDLMREMALWITSDDPRFMEKPMNPRFMVKAGLLLEEIPSEMEHWKQDLDKVSLMSNKILEIPSGTSPKCPILSTLILRSNPFYEIPESFFVHMCGLKILNLSRTNILRLPNSVSELVNLKALLLRRCTRLISLPSLKKLRELRELDLSFTDIKEVIDGMESLANLKCLNLEGASLKMLPSGTLRKLAHLQRLICPMEMPEGHVAVEEVEGLRRLEEFRGVFFSISDLSKFIKSQYRTQLNVYDVEIREVNNPCGFDDMIRFSCKKATIRKCISRRNLTMLLWDNDLILRWDKGQLSIKSCHCEYLLRLQSDEEPVTQETSGLLGENLEHLQLYSLSNLLDIIKCDAEADGIPPPGTFSNLRKLEIVRCENIKTLLPQALVDNLQNLEEIRVETCGQIEDIIGKGKGIHKVVTLPRLKVLRLARLPQLKSISMSTIICDSIETIEISGCHKLKKIMNWVWEPTTGVVGPPPGALSRLKKLDISLCGSIKKLFPWDLAGNLENLEELKVCDCEQLEEIIGDDEGIHCVVTLARLKVLHLTDLPRLMNISTSTIICDSIETIEISGCHKLKKIMNWVWEPTTGVVGPPPGALSHLKKLDISSCRSIKKLFPWDLAGNLENLEELKVCDSEQLEEIIGDDEGIHWVVTLARLKVLHLTDLPRLMNISTSTIICDSIETIEISGCNKLKKIMNWIWEPTTGAVGPPPGALSRLKKLYICSCRSIKKLFPWGLAGNLQHLEEFKVCDCEQLEEIIGDDEGIHSVVTVPRLKVLHLTDLPRLMNISTSTIICDSIETIEISGCHKLKKIRNWVWEPTTGAVGPPPGALSRFKKLEISLCGSINPLGFGGQPQKPGRVEGQ